MGYHRLGLRRRSVGVQQILVADHEHALGQPRDLAHGALDALDDERARCAAHHLPAAEAMNVRVVPVQSGWFVLRNSEAVLERRVAQLAETFPGDATTLVATDMDGLPVGIAAS